MRPLYQIDNCGLFCFSFLWLSSEQYDNYADKNDLSIGHTANAHLQKYPRFYLPDFTMFF